DPGRAYTLFAYIIGLDTACCFHFEASADLFDQPTLALLRTAPPGRIQLEIGLQSFYEPTLQAVSRRTDLKKAEDNIRALLSGQNIHIHLDLIAGLPFETLPRFQDSFDRAYALSAHTLQLGFLKLLHGSKLREQAGTLGIVYNQEPPYEILRSPWISGGELRRLKQAENALRHTYNKGRFLSVLDYTLAVSGLRPFELYRGMGETAPNHAVSLEKYAGQIYEYCAGLPGIDTSELRDRMVCDLLRMTKGKSMPPLLIDHTKQRKQAAAQAGKRLGHPVDSDEVAILSTGKAVFADSGKRSLVTGLYELGSIP
ncbi:MAG: DUF4080 domain-containing protein, partial [Oscillospiraceae bacterium]|nr:DUF4080 domain-containing protein [Oscillospiraceae bacterium]